MNLTRADLNKEIAETDVQIARLTAVKSFCGYLLKTFDFPEGGEVAAEEQKQGA